MAVRRDSRLGPFAGIFKRNLLKNAPLPVVVPRDAQAELFARARRHRVRRGPGEPDADAPRGRKVEFPVNEFSKHRLLEGIDVLWRLVSHEEAVRACEAQRAGIINRSHRRGRGVAGG